RVLMLISTAKLSEKAEELFKEEAVPIQYRMSAMGTASSEIMDMLGLGSTDKSILISVLTKDICDGILRKMQKKLKLGTVNSGIAFTLPITGANNHVLRILEQNKNKKIELPERRGNNIMSDVKYALVAAVVNQGHSDKVMEAARAAGAAGGTVFHGRRIINEEAVDFWGLGVQEEKETVLIITDSDTRVKIMQAIGEKCGIKTESQGIVISMPIDDVIGFADVD
ncbi:MAG: hypothetical protein ACI4QR_04020, partial [Eubacteriales bacterium]